MASELRFDLTPLGNDAGETPPSPRPIGLRIGDGRIFGAVRDAPRPREVVEAGD